MSSKVISAVLFSVIVKQSGQVDSAMLANVVKRVGQYWFARVGQESANSIKNEKFELSGSKLSTKKTEGYIGTKSYGCDPVVEWLSALVEASAKFEVKYGIRCKVDEIVDDKIAFVISQSITDAITWVEKNTQP